MIVHFFKSFFQLFEPRVMKIMLISGFSSVVCTVVLGVLLYQGITLVPFADIPWIGAWLTSSSIGDWVLTSSVVVFLILCGMFVFPYVLLGVSGFFQERIISLVEGRHYPNLPAPMGRRTRDEVVQQLKFFAMVLGVNLVFAPLYLILMFTGFGAILLSALVNGYLIGVEYYNMVGLRRLTENQYENSLRKHRVLVHLYGVVIYFLMLVPLVNLLLPVFACMLVTHLFHSHHRDDSYMTSAQG